MLRTFRLIAAVLFLTLLTLLFLDFSGTVHPWFGWMAKIQFLPALLAWNVGVVGGLLLLTLVFGRVYCSVVCPLGVFQDAVSWIAGKRKKNRFRYSPALSLLRYSMLGLLVVALVAGVGSLVALLAPYSSYGRMATNLFSPVWQWGNNGLAYWAERTGRYTFYSVDVWMKGLSTFFTAVATFLVVGALAWRNGRTYCNTICPVGTFLGFFARYAWFKPVIDSSKCVDCQLCARNCKASCIEVKTHRIDYSRCVACMDCVEKCRYGAIRYVHQPGLKPATLPVNLARRRFLTTAAFLATASGMKAQEKKVDGGLAILQDKQAPHRSTPLAPPGSSSLRQMYQHCTACQLCVSACPNQVLRPSADSMAWMQPEMSYERGYCRPECVRCSEVCPAGAIRPITVADKSAIQVGHAVWVRKNCIPLTDGMACDNCARHCPTGAIQMVPLEGEAEENSLHIPVVDMERCIGCGACENLCPARPFSAIYVEGHEVHRMV